MNIFDSPDYMNVASGWIGRTTSQDYAYQDKAQKQAAFMSNRAQMQQNALSWLGSLPLPAPKLSRPQQLLKEAQARHPEWKVKRILPVEYKHVAYGYKDGKIGPIYD